MLSCTLGVGAILLSVDYLPIAGVNKGEYYPLLLFAVLGVVIMAVGNLIALRRPASSACWLTPRSRTPATC